MESFNWIIIWAFILSSVLIELKATCVKTACDCYEDEYSGLVEYQCPNRMKTRAVIRTGENQNMEIICRDEQDVGRFLPKQSFSYEHVTTESCRISGAMANVINITNVKTLKFDHSILQKDFLHFIFSMPLARLERLTFKATQLKNISFQNLNAPNLFFVDFEMMDYYVASKVLSSLTKIEVLNFINNEIKSLENNTFENLTNLTELHMMFNSLEIINIEAFKDLKNLKILNLANNNIGFISREALKPLESLYHVTLEGNPGLLLDNYLFANFSKLTVVHLGASDLTSVPENIFSGSTRISEISLDYNNISYIPRGLFEGLIHLKSLDMKFNRIKSLNGVIQGLMKLQTLELNNNEISALGLNDFSGLSSLVDLNLNNNNISIIHEYAFRSNLKLEELGLSNNKYQYEVVSGRIFTNTPFSQCERLKSLDLSFNLMKDVPDDIFLNARLLKNLNLEGNKIEKLDLEDIQKWNIAFRGVEINLRNNDINHFFFDQSTLDKIDPDYDLPMLEELAFGGNMNIEAEKRGQQSKLLISQTVRCDCSMEPLTEFTRREDTGIFLDLNQLTCNSPPDKNGIRLLDVPASELTCDLSSVTEDSQCTNSEYCSCLWRPHDSSIVVNCSSGNITRAPAIIAPMNFTYETIEVHLEHNLLTDFSAVEGYENVTSLFLASNHIDNVSWIPPNIEVIDLSYNNLTRLSYFVSDMLSESSVKNITLGKNPWSCDCDNYNLTNFLRKNIKKVDVQNIKCAISGLTMYHINREDICNEIHLYMILVALIFGPIIVCLILVILFYKYKQEIKVWLYARNLCTRFLVEEDLDEHKEYDVFVSYSQRDADFVEKTLVPIMEDSPYQYKLCLHYRDWIPGSFITENIANSVTKSRRTLIVLTSNFLDSIWGKMEFRAAHAEALRERRNRVILLLKEDIDTQKLDDELRLYVATNTYIRWEDPWFWKKLTNALKRSERSIDTAA